MLTALCVDMTNEDLYQHSEPLWSVTFINSIRHVPVNSVTYLILLSSQIKGGDECWAKISNTPLCSVWPCSRYNQLKFNLVAEWLLWLHLIYVSYLLVLGRVPVHCGMERERKRKLIKVHSCAIISSTAMKSLFYETSFNINLHGCSDLHFSCQPAKLCTGSRKTNLLSDVAVRGDGWFRGEQRQWVCNLQLLL